MVGELRKMGIDVRDPDQPVGTLSGGERQAVAIARAVYFGAKVLILDEPTSALGVKQSGVVLRYVAQARDRGLGVIFITHNPHHAYPVGDRFVILNRGRLMGDWRKSRDHARRARQADVRRRRARRARARARARAPRHERDDGDHGRAGHDRPRPPAHRRRRDRLRLAGPGPQPLAAADPDAVPGARRSTPSWCVCGDTRARAPRRRGALVRLRRAARRTGARSSTTRTSTSSSSPRRTCSTSSWSRRPPRPASTCSARSRSAARRSRRCAPRRAARHAGVISGVGYNYRWAPLVQYARS